MKKLKLLFATLALLVGGVISVWADNTSVLTDNGWTRVSEITNVDNNFYVFVDAGALDCAMTRTSNGRPVYTTLANPASNIGFVWALSGTTNFTLKAIKDETFFYAGANGWNNSMSYTQSSEFSFTANDGKYQIQTTANISVGTGEGKYVGPWDGKGFSFDQDNNTAHRIVTNKSQENTDGFYIYSISRLAFAKQYLAGATEESPKDASAFIVNRSFETGNTNGWTLASTSADTGAKDYAMSPGKDGTYIFNTWWTGVPMTQTIANLPNGTYELSAYIGSSDDNDPGKVFLTANGEHSTVFSFTTKTQNTGVLCSYEFNVTNHSATIGIVGANADGSYNASGHWWYKVDNFQLKYKGIDLSNLSDLLTTAVTKAQGLVDGNTIPNAAEEALQQIINANDNDDNAFDEEDQFTDAINAINTAYDTYKALESPYASFTALKSAADAIAAVEYEEKTAGSNSTFTAAISTQNTAAEAAITASGITDATSALVSAIKTYISSAEPKNEGEYFDITCLIENPSFGGNNTTGWSGTSPNAVSYGCAEFFNMNFDFYQNLTGLANGSYQLTVQAYCRPGANGNETSGAYYDYTQGINNITAELYVNSDASTIGNIYSYKNNTTAAKVDGNDFHCNISTDNYWVPNNMQGASLYFADDAYVTEVAALVTDGNLKIGFREANKKTNQWVIFDNFKLYYYGSSKLIYYQQYLPQLRTEVSADLSNGAYASALVSSEDEALDAALAAAPASETEEAYETVINSLKEAQTAFRAAALSYDAMVAAKATALTKISDNIGTGVFQYNETTNNSLFSAYETAKSAVDSYTQSTSSTAAGAQALVDALNEAISNYQNQPLNAPDASKAYVLQNTTASCNLTVSTESVTISASGKVYFTAVDGGYVISNSVGEYISKTTGNNWTLSTTETKEDAYVVTVQYEGDGAYSIHGEKGYFGTDNTAAGSAVYANKATSNNGLWKIYPTVSMTVSVAGMATYVNSDYALDFSESDIKAYKVKVTDKAVATLTQVDKVPANTPVLLYYKGGKTEDIPVIASADAVSDNDLVAGTGATVATIDGDYTNMILNNGEDGIGFYFANDQTVATYRAYLHIPTTLAPNEGAGARGMRLVFDGDITGISEAAASAEAAQKDGKFFENNKLVIFKNGKKFNANGAQMK